MSSSFFFLVASPKLLCTPKTSLVADSPLLQSLKSEKQPRSVYPKYSQRFLIKDLVGSSVSREDCPSTPDMMQKNHASKSCHSLVKSVQKASWNTPLRVPKTPSSVTMVRYRYTVNPENIFKHGKITLCCKCMCRVASLCCDHLWV